MSISLENIRKSCVEVSFYKVAGLDGFLTLSGATEMQLSLELGLFKIDNWGMEIHRPRKNNHHGIIKKCRCRIISESWRTINKRKGYFWVVHFMKTLNNFVITVTIRNQPFCKYAKFSEKLTCLSPWYAHALSRIKG